jgi:hypothetical protein
MTLKMYQLIELTPIFDKMKSSKLPFKTAYRVTLLMQETEKHLNFYQESFRNLLTEYGKKDENGNIMPTEDGQGVLLAEETMQEAYQKLGELRELDVELPDYKFDLDAFGDIEISPQEMLALMPFIEA